MNRNHFIFATIAGAMIFSVACKKDIADLDNTYPGNTSSNGALANFIAQNAPPVQQFTINAANGGMIYGANGAIITINPNSFVYQNNQPVTGNVTVSLMEVYSKRDIIFSGGFTTSSGLPLTSGGEINMTAYQGTQELRLANAYSVTVKIPAPTNAPPMQEWIASSLNAATDFQRVDTGSGNVTVVQDSSFAVNYYEFQLDSLDWTNCDQYLNYNAVQTEFNIPLPALYDDENTMMIVTSQYSQYAAKIHFFDEATNAFDCGYYRLTVGDQYTFTSISEINGAFYYDSRTVTITEGISVTMNPQPMSEAQILQNINSL